MKDELDKCLLCKNPSCEVCPTGTQIRLVISNIREGEIEKAGALLFENNPLSAITGSICPNHLYCNKSCVLAKKDKAVNFGKIEATISREYLNNLASGQKVLNFSTQNSKSVMIVGSGPAGLGLAYYLRKKGYVVTVFEKEDKIGGMLRYGIPDFRLDKTLIDKLGKILADIGVIFKTNTTVDIEQIEERRKEFDIVILAIGAGVAKQMDIEGENLPIAQHAVDYLRNPTPADNVIVIGGGNVAIDCALTAKHLPHTSVKIYYRRREEDMRSYPKELELAKNFGIAFGFLMIPKKITDKGVAFEKDGAEIFVPADRVIIAVGQQATPNGNIASNNYRTAIDGVYAIGDAITGTQTVVKAIAAAKELAKIL